MEEVVKCAACGSNFTHQATVIVRQREAGEDGPGVRTEVSSGTCTVRAIGDWQDPKAGWKGRRDDVSIMLFCEQCDAQTELIVKQHKGETLIETRLVP